MKLYTLSSLLITCTLLLPCTAQAEENSSDNGVLTLEEVTVTATKREGSAKDFPGNISVMEEPFMEEHGVNDLQDLMRFSPNVYVKNRT